MSRANERRTVTVYRNGNGMRKVIRRITAPHSDVKAGEDPGDTSREGLYLLDQISEQTDQFGVKAYRVRWRHWKIINVDHNLSAMLDIPRGMIMPEVAEEQIDKWIAEANEAEAAEVRERTWTEERKVDVG